jgi:hypothetical protein
MNARLSTLLALLILACGSSMISNADQARVAWLGLDGVVGKAITLGFKGFNDASSANIPTESTTGADGGTLTVTGQVDQGASANKTMRLSLALASYSDGVVQLDGGAPVHLVYDTTGSAPAFDLQLKNIPTGTWSGTLVGGFTMSGALTGAVTLDLAIAGQLEADATGKVQPKAGTTHVTGTATSPVGSYQVDVTE